MPTTIESTAEQLQRRYNFVLRAGTVLLLLAVVVYGWLSLNRHRDDLRAEVDIQAQELQLVLNHTVDRALMYAFTLRRSAEYRVLHPGPVDMARLKALQDGSSKDDDGSLYVDPAAKLDPQAFQSGLWAAMAMSRVAAPTHRWLPAFQWSYFYDVNERWFLIYPRLPRDELLRVTATRDTGAALRAIFEGDGTRPVPRTGPRNNPQREMVWTRPYKDAAGKGLMVSLLAPVYLGDDHVGTVGTDITLASLDKVLRELPLLHGRALVVDGGGMLLADSGGALKSVSGPVKAAEALPGVPLAAGGDMGREWRRLPIKGTDWVLLVQVPERTLLATAAWEMRAYFVISLLLLLALLGAASFQNRKFSWPALRLARYAEKVQDDPGLAPPEVPAEWQPSFERLAAAARERQALLEAARQHAVELERRVAERTAALTQANGELAATVQSLQQTQHQLVRADRLGNLGSMVADVAHELRVPISRAGREADALRTALAQFRELQKLGLRRAELEDFLARVDTSSNAIATSAGEAQDLVQRFKQLAVDRGSERVREFAPRSLIDDVLAVMSPTLRQAGCSTRNDVPAELEMRGDAGTLGQVVTELVQDARNRSASTITLGARWEAGTEGETITFQLEDNGAGGGADSAGNDLVRRLAKEVLGGDLVIEAAGAGRRTSLRVPATTA